MINKDKVKVFKLVTGDEFLAEVVDSNDECYTLKKPTKFQTRGVAPDKPGEEPRTMLIPAPLLWYGDIEEPVTLFKSELVVLPVKPDNDILDAYEKVHTDIDLPPAKKLIT